MADPSSPTSLSGTRSTEEVRDDGQTDFFSSLWAPIARILTPERTERDTLAFSAPSHGRAMAPVQQCDAGPGRARASAFGLGSAFGFRTSGGGCRGAIN